MLKTKRAPRVRGQGSDLRSVFHFHQKVRSQHIQNVEQLRSYNRYCLTLEGHAVLFIISLNFFIFFFINSFLFIFFEKRGPFLFALSAVAFEVAAFWSLGRQPDGSEGGVTQEVEGVGMRQRHGRDVRRSWEKRWGGGGCTWRL